LHPEKTHGYCGKSAHANPPLPPRAGRETSWVVRPCSSHSYKYTSFPGVQAPSLSRAGLHKREGRVPTLGISLSEKKSGTGILPLAFTVSFWKSALAVWMSDLSGSTYWHMILRILQVRYAPWFTLE
jgi:hypothetical protein